MLPGFVGGEGKGCVRWVFSALGFFCGSEPSLTYCEAVCQVVEVFIGCFRKGVGLMVIVGRQGG